MQWHGLYWDTGTAGVSPAMSAKRESSSLLVCLPETLHLPQVGGRDARGPSEVQATLASRIFKVRC